MTPVATADRGMLTSVDGTATHRQMCIKGLRVHVEIHGEGEPLLLHSGLWAETGLWRPLLPHLDGYQVIAFDPPGVGRSEMPRLPMTMMGLASMGAAILDELGLESANVLGTSFGGAVAQQMAVTQRRRVRKLVLVSTSFGGLSWPGEPMAYWHFLQPSSYRPHRMQQVAGEMFGGRLRTQPELIRGMHIRRPGSFIAAMYRMVPLVGWTSLPWLWAIRQPTLVVCGDDDPITPHINHAVMAAMMPRATLHVVRGGGHLALVDSPGEVAPVIAGFLGAQAAPLAPEASIRVRPAA